MKTPRAHRGTNLSAKIDASTAIEIFRAKLGERTPRDGTAARIAAKHSITQKAVRDIWNLRTWAAATQPIWAPADHKRWAKMHGAPGKPSAAPPTPFVPGGARAAGAQGPLQTSQAGTLLGSPTGMDAARMMQGEQNRTVCAAKNFAATAPSMDGAGYLVACAIQPPESPHASAFAHHSRLAHDAVGARFPGASALRFSYSWPNMHGHFHDSCLPHAYPPAWYGAGEDGFDAQGLATYASVDRWRQDASAAREERYVDVSRLDGDDLAASRMLGLALPEMAEQLTTARCPWPSSLCIAQPAFSDSSNSLVSQASTEDGRPDGCAAAGPLPGCVRPAFEFEGDCDRFFDVLLPNTGMFDAGGDADRYKDISWVLDHHGFGNTAE